MSELEVGGPVALIGAGKMGGALMDGWLALGLPGNQMIVRDPAAPPEISRLIVEHGISLNPEIEALAARRPRIVLLAVKPQMFGDVLPGLKPLVAKDTVFVSIAAGISLAGLEALLGAEAEIVRAMPNTPSAVGRGVTALIANGHVEEAAKTHVTALMSAVGEAHWLASEELMDAVTALSGSGPAYIFHMVEAMAEAGIKLGLEPEMAMAFARATVAGAGEMLHRSELPAAKLRQNVTSPGGTTEAALKVLMGEEGLARLMEAAMAAARDRSRELGS